MMYGFSAWLDRCKGNYLPLTELKKEAKRKGKPISIYKTLDRLCPENDDVLGKYLFCYEDLSKDHETDEAKEKELNKLVKKLEGYTIIFFSGTTGKRLSQSLNPKVMVTRL